MAGMTTEQLKQFISETTIPLLKDAVSAQVADLVKANIEEALKKTGPAQDVRMRLFGGEEPVPTPAEKGAEFARCVRAVAAAKLAGQAPEYALTILRAWGDTKLADRWEGSRSKALSAGDPTSGGFLIPPQFSGDVIELLRPAAVVRSLNPLTMPMPMGVLKVPKITTGSTAYYVGENANITQSEQKFGQITLAFKKLAAVVPLSNDLIRYSAPNADEVVRDDVVRALAQREDQAFLRDDGTSGTPRGLKHWVHTDNKLTANSSVSLANVTTDLGRMVQALMDADIPLMVGQNLPGTTSAVPGTSRAGWIMSPRTWRYLTTVLTSLGTYAFRDEMLRGLLWGFPYRVTSQVLQTYDSGGTVGAGTYTELYFGAFAHAVIGEALGLQVDASQDAAYANAAGTVVAAFSQDQTVVRVLAEHDFCLRHDKAFALLSSVSWGA